MGLRDWARGKALDAVAKDLRDRAQGIDTQDTSTKWWEGAVLASLSTIVATLPAYLYDGLTGGEIAALVGLFVNTMWARFKESGPKSSPRVVWFEGLMFAGIAAGVAMLPEVFKDGHIDTVEGYGMLSAAITALAARFKESQMPPWDHIDRRTDAALVVPIVVPVETAPPTPGEPPAPVVPVVVPDEVGGN